MRTNWVSTSKDLADFFLHRIRPHDAAPTARDRLALAWWVGGGSLEGVNF